MEIKIYVDESPIYITDQLSVELKQKSTGKDVLFINQDFSFVVETILKALKKNKKEVIILVEDIEKAKTDFFKNFCR